MVGIEDEWAAYQFDSACAVVGRMAVVAARQGKDVRALLAGEGERADRGNFRSAKGWAVKKVKIPESGVW